MIRFELDTDHELFEQTFSFAQQQVRKLIERSPNFYPMYTQQGKWQHQGPAWTEWCDGFLPGMMWIFYKRLFHTSEGPYWMGQAIRYTKPIEPRQFDQETHDHGFLFFTTYYRWYQVTKDAALHDVLVQAARTLASRYNEQGEYLRSFIAEDSLFVDLMMNVGLIFLAARDTGDKRLRDIAVRHCLTTRRGLVRGDGSTAHEGIFDLDTGEFLRQSTQQGFRGDSCWARGHTWALYGFTVAFEYSRDPRFLETAQAVADFFIVHTPSDGVPPWDFNATPNESGVVMQDTSAAAIAASGLLRLCRLTADPVKGHFYWSTAVRILRTLCEMWVASDDPHWEGILKGGVYHMRQNLGVNESVIWGEYFFVEALAQVLRQIKPQS